MKKALKWILIIAAALIAVFVGIVISLVLSVKPEQAKTQDVSSYLSEQWGTFRVEDYNETTGALTLAYDTTVRYEQAEKYGADSYADVAQGHIATMQTIKSGCASFCGVSLTTITINGYSSDEKLIYTVTDSGDITACWQ